MDDGLKQRLVGALVLAAVAVLFLPSLLDRDGSRSVDLTSQVPSEPVVVTEPLVIPVPQSPQGIESAKPPESSYSHEEPQLIEDDGAEENTAVSAITNEVVAEEGNAANATDSAAPESPVSENAPLNAQGVPNAWSIQVGSFSDEKGANSLKARVIEAGFDKTYVRSAEVNGKMVYRVYVGPKINKSLAEKDQQSLEKVLGSKTLLVKFQP